MWKAVITIAYQTVVPGKNRLNEYRLYYQKVYPWFNHAHATNTAVQKLCLQPHKWSPIAVFQDSKSAELQFNSKLGHHNNRSKQNWLEQQFTERKFTQSPVITMYNFWSKLSLTQFISRPYVCMPVFRYSSIEQTYSKVLTCQENDHTFKKST